MQRVDPFIPVASQQPMRQTPVRTSSSPSSSRAGDNIPRFVSPREPSPRPQQTLPYSQFTPLATKQFAPKPTPTTPTKKTRLRAVLATLWQALLLLGALGLGFVIRSVIVGQIAVLIYAVLALAYRVESRTTFILGVMAFGVVLISSLRADATLATAFAVYAFLLLIVGTISLAREVRDDI